jgi:hypothetical protein
MSKNSNADLHTLNDVEIPSMIQTIGQVKKIILKMKRHAETCKCCMDVMNNSQIDLTVNHMVQEGRADQTHPLTNPTETQTQSHNSNLDHLARRPNNRYVV